MTKRLACCTFACVVVVALMPVPIPGVATAATSSLQVSAPASVITFTENDTRNHIEPASEATPKPCPNDAGQGTFNVTATLERRPWQDNHLGHAYWVEFEALGDWRRRAVEASLHVQQRRPGAWRWGTIGNHSAPIDRPWVTHATVRVRPGYDFWAAGVMTWRPGFITPRVTLMNIKCRDPG